MKQRNFRPVAPQTLFPDRTRPRRTGHGFEPSPSRRGSYDRPTPPMNRGYGEPAGRPPRRIPWRNIGRGLGAFAGWNALADALGLDPWGVPFIKSFPPDYHSKYRLMYRCDATSDLCGGTMNPAQPYATRPASYTGQTACPSLCTNHGPRFTTFDQAALQDPTIGSWVTWYLKRSITTGNVGREWKRFASGVSVTYVVAPAPVFYPDGLPDPLADPQSQPDFQPEKWYGSGGSLVMAPRSRPGVGTRPDPAPEPGNPVVPPGTPRYPAVEYGPDDGPPKPMEHVAAPPRGRDRERKEPPWKYGDPGRIYGALTEGGDAAGCMIEAMGGSSKGLGTRGKFLKAWQMANDPDAPRPDGDVFVACMVASQAQDAAIGRLSGGAAKAQNRSPYSPKRPGGYRGGGWGTRMH